jgi:hypothetical protein
MKTVLWLLLLICVGLLGYFVFDFARHRRTQVDLLPYEVTDDTIAVYEARADELATRADSIRQRLGKLGLLSRPAVLARVTDIEQEVANLRRAVENWKAARPARKGGDLYRQCILVYGRASGVCDALARDTLPPAQHGR